MSRYGGMKDSRVYVGNLPPDIRTKDIEDLFYKYGNIQNIELKNNGGPPFSFIDYDDPRDAEDAIKCRDGYNYDGYTLRVEYPKGNSMMQQRRGPYGGGMGSRSFSGRAGGPPSRRTQFRALVSGLPPSGSWQDLKDHMREAGDVCYADTFKDGTGVVEFLRKEDLKYAVRKLDDTKFRSHEGEVSYLRVKEDNPRDSGSRSPSPRRHSPRYSPVRDRKMGRSYSRSRSPRSPHY